MIDLAVEWRREAIRFALAAAEVSWLAPAFVALSQTQEHPLLIFWLGLLVIYLAYSYLYRALVEAHLALWLQQALLVLSLLLGIALVLRFHVYAGSDLPGMSWLLDPFRHFGDEMAGLPASWSAMFVLVYLWARGVHLGRRSVSIESVGFSFRLGVVIFIGVVLLARSIIGLDVSAFIVPYFFFALVAVALARIEEVSLTPNSGHVRFSGFWIGSTVGAVGLLMVASGVVAFFFYGGGLRQVLHWLTPVAVALQIVIAAIGVLVLALVQAILALFSIDLGALGDRLREAMQRLGALSDLGRLVPPAAESTGRPAFMTILQAVITTGIPLVIVLVVVLITWNRVRRARRMSREEMDESSRTEGSLTDSLRAALEAGRDRLGDLAGLVDRFGLGARFLSAISIRRIYANLMRLAAGAGYPRGSSQTPYEYLNTLRKAMPDSYADVMAITEAYVNAHYGKVPDSREELQEVRDCWERVRSREAERAKLKKLASS